MAKSLLLVRSDDNYWTVVVDGKFADGLTNDEALGCVASMIYRNTVPYVRTPREQVNCMKSLVDPPSLDGELESDD